MSENKYIVCYKCETYNLISKKPEEEGYFPMVWRWEDFINLHRTCMYGRHVDIISCGDIK